MIKAKREEFCIQIRKEKNRIFFNQRRRINLNNLKKKLQSNKISQTQNSEITSGPQQIKGLCF